MHRFRLISAAAAVVAAAGLAVLGLGPAAAQADTGGGAGVLPPGDIALYPDGGTGSGGVATGSDGNLWIVDSNRSRIIAYSPTEGGVVGTYNVPGSPTAIVAGPGGNLWFDLGSYGANGSAIGEITTSGAVTVFPLPAEDGAYGLDGLAVGPDGDLWYTFEAEGADNGYVGTMTPSGTVTQYPMPDEFIGSMFDITAGPDGNLWFVGQVGSDQEQAGLGTVTTSGAISIEPLPYGDFEAGGITAGPDGRLWFTLNQSTIGTSLVGAVTTSGTLSLYPLPGWNLHPSDIAAGPDGNLYVADGLSPGPDNDYGNIVAVTPGGQMALYTEMSWDAPVGITAGPDGEMWFSDSGYGEIGKLTISKPDAAKVNVTSDANPATFGQSGDLIASVAPEDPEEPVPTGTATFVVNGVPTATVPLVDGTVSIPLDSLGPSENTTAVTYNGDADYGPVTSQLYYQQVQTSTTTMALTPSANPSGTGQDVTVTATVTPQAPGGGTPTGYVSFNVDGSNQNVSLTDSNGGVATLDLPNLTAGNHSISAYYTPANSQYATQEYQPSSASLTQTVDQASTAAVALTASANPMVYGQNATVTATVTPGATGGPAPTGSVTFAIDGTAQSPVPVGDSGSAALALPALGAGAHTITATYSGDSTYPSGSASPLTETVNQDTTATDLVASANPATSGQMVTFTATVAAQSPGSGTPTGSVVFTVDGVAQPAESLDAGAATFAEAWSSPGSHAVTAVYSGDGDFAASSSAALSETVNPNPITVVSPDNPSVTGQRFGMTAVVAPSTAGGAVPTGTVTFTVDGTAGSPVLLKAGSAKYAVPALAAGYHTVTVSYSGDSANPPATSNALTQVVDPAGTTVTVTSTPSSAVVGQAVTLHAAVSAAAPGTGTADGTVAFTVDGIDQGPVTLDSTGKATLKVTGLALGTHTVTATYSGSANYRASSSAALQQQVVQGSSAVTLTSSANPSTSGTGVVFTAKVKAAAPATGTPSGAVVFVIDGAAQSPVTMDSTGVAKLWLSGLQPGTHTIEAEYSGSAAYAASDSPTLAQTVN